LQKKDFEKQTVINSKKIFLFLLLTKFLFLSNTCHSSIFDKITSIPKNVSRWTIRKAFDKTFNSSSLQGAAAGTGISLLADLLIKKIQENDAESDEADTTTSILSLVVASMLGSFILSDQDLLSTATYAIELSLVLSAINFAFDLGVDYESAYEEEKSELFRENLINAIKQTCLNFIACVSGKYAKTQIEGLKALGRAPAPPPRSSDVAP
jgi:hypothetical protein